MNIIGIDLAKNTFSVCVMSERGKVLIRRTVSRGRLFEYVLQQGDGIVAMEACGGAHYWGRRFREAGFEVRLIAAQFVKPFVKSNKNDELDAEAICEAASRKQMRFVSLRSEWQQDIQNVHRVRERMVKQRTGLCNELRGLLLEYGIIIPKGITALRRALPEILDREHSRSALWRETFLELFEELHGLDKRIAKLDERLEQLARDCEQCQRLLKIPGVGVLTATAVTAAVGDIREFKNGRQFAAWLGLVPSQHSTGGRTKLGRISKRGDRYLRKLLILGARSRGLSIGRSKKQDYTSLWMLAVKERRGLNRALVAMANKTARTVWYVLAKDVEFREYQPLAA